VVKIRASPQRREHFYQQCVATNLPELELIPDIVTRWNSTDIMLERALKLRKALDNTALTIKDLIRYRLSDNEWIIIDEIHELMKVCNLLTNILIYYIYIIYLFF
jgi:hypothetical protein